MQFCWVGRAVSPPLRGREDLMLSKYASLILMVTATSASAFAQADRGTIRGSVSDPSGAVIPGASVAALNVQTGIRTATTSTSAGSYNIPNLPPGVYSLEIEQTGFKKLIRPDVRVNAGMVVALDVALEVGKTAETVTVTSAAPQL